MTNDLDLLPTRVVTDGSLDTVRPHTYAVALEVLRKYPVYFCWGEGATGEHHEGRALDFMTYGLGGGVNHPGPLRINLGSLIATYLWDNRTRLGIWYIIYRQQIRSTTKGKSGLWERMPDRGNPTANHMDHCHVSFLNGAVYRAPGAPAKPAKPKPKPEATVSDADKLLAAVNALAKAGKDQYADLLKNVQQEDPRWINLNIRLDAIDARLAELAKTPPAA